MWYLSLWWRYCFGQLYVAHFPSDGLSFCSHIVRNDHQNLLSFLELFLRLSLCPNATNTAPDSTETDYRCMQIKWTKQPLNLSLSPHYRRGRSCLVCSDVTEPLHSFCGMPGGYKTGNGSLCISSCSPLNRNFRGHKGSIEARFIPLFCFSSVNRHWHFLLELTLPRVAIETFL